MSSITQTFWNFVPVSWPLLPLNLSTDTLSSSHCPSYAPCAQPLQSPPPHHIWNTLDIQQSVGQLLTWPFVLECDTTHVVHNQHFRFFQMLLVFDLDWSSLTKSLRSSHMLHYRYFLSYANMLPMTLVLGTVHSLLSLLSAQPLQQP